MSTLKHDQDGFLIGEAMVSVNKEQLKTQIEILRAVRKLNGKSTGTKAEVTKQAEVIAETVGDAVERSITKATSRPKRPLTKSEKAIVGTTRPTIETQVRRAPNGQFMKASSMPTVESKPRTVEETIRAISKYNKPKDTAMNRALRLIGINVAAGNKQNSLFDRTQAKLLKELVDKPVSGGKSGKNSGSGLMATLGGGALSLLNPLKWLSRGRSAMGGVNSLAESLAKGDGVAMAGGAARGAGGLLRGAGRLGLGALKRVPVLGALLGLGTAAMASSAIDGDDGLSESEKSQKKAGAWGSAGGGLAGAAGGAALGAAIGSVVPVVGTAIGGLAGAVIGGLGGEKIGESVGEWLYKKDWKTGWDGVRTNISSNWTSLTHDIAGWAKAAWDGISISWPNVAKGVESAFEGVKTTVSEGVQAAKDAYNGVEVQGANADGSQTMAQKIGSVAGGAAGRLVNGIGEAGYAMTQKYDNLKYKMGGKSLDGSAIDCSGWTFQVSKMEMESINKATGKEIFSKKDINRLNTGAVEQVANIAQKNGIETMAKDGQSLDLSKVKEGMTIGLYSKTSKYKGRTANIGGREERLNHIVKVVKDPKTGELMASESEGGHGVKMTSLSKWASRNSSRKANMIVVDALKKARTEIGGETSIQSAHSNISNVTGGVIKPKGAKGSLTAEQLNATFAADERLGFPKGTVAGQMYQESKFDPNAKSHAGAKGWAQIMPKTQAGIEKSTGRKYDASNFFDSLAMLEETYNDFKYVGGKKSNGKANIEQMMRGYNGGYAAMTGQGAGKSVENREYYRKVQEGREFVLAAAGKSLNMPASNKHSDNEDITRLAAQRLREDNTRGSVNIAALNKVNTLPTISTAPINPPAISAAAIPVPIRIPSIETQVPLNSQSASTAPIIVNGSDRLSRDVSHRGIAHVASGGISSGLVG